jgi:hypothetical protein
VQPATRGQGPNAHHGLPQRRDGKPDASHVLGAKLELDHSSRLGHLQIFTLPRANHGTLEGVSIEAIEDAYQRLHRTGPEWGENTLTNHGPMVAETLARRGRGSNVDGWLNNYVRRLRSPAQSSR